MTGLPEHRRSVGFLETDEGSWACFLVTFPATSRSWHGYFSFRPSHGGAEEDEIRTTDIFVESTEADIHEKARSLGRPLLQGLLESALHTSARSEGATPRLVGRFRSLLKANSLELSGPLLEDRDAPEPQGMEQLRSMYESYRIDQVSHFICLLESSDFDSAVDRILEGERIDFRAKDRLQFAMMVVDFIERHLPLPDFDTWAADFVANPAAYRLYAHTLHREGRLP